MCNRKNIRLRLLTAFYIFIYLFDERVIARKLDTSVNFPAHPFSYPTPPTLRGRFGRRYLLRFSSLHSSYLKALPQAGEPLRSVYLETL